MVSCLRNGFAAVLCLLVSVCALHGDSISLDLGSFVPSIESVPQSAALVAGTRRVVERVTAPGCSSSSSSGDPSLPLKTLYIAIPADADEHSVTVRVSRPSVSEIEGEYDILPVPPALSANGVESWGYGKQIISGRNQLVYAKDGFYPAEHVQVRDIGRLRTWKIVSVDVWPCRYNPVTGKLRVLAAGTISVDYSTQPTVRTPSDPVAADMGGFVSNLSQAREFYPTASVVPTADYAIITTSAIASSSAALASFVAYKEYLGHKVKIVTESGWGGGTGDVAANNIRAWLRANYIPLGLRYVLLIGDPSPPAGSVPMKLMWPRRHEVSFKDAPSDYYYADLTGNWDLDRDGYYGEEPDDFGPGGIDRIPELYVGRIPYYGNIAALDSILQKSIAYESAISGAWSRNFLLPMKQLDSETPGYLLGEMIASDIARPLLMNPRRIYDATFALTPPPELQPCDIPSVASEWQKNAAGVVVWMTHGSQTLASGVMSTDKCAGLDDSRPAVVFAASCDNGYPENPENLGYALLRRGAVCTVSASRPSFYLPGEVEKGTDTIAGMSYAFAHNLLDLEQDCGGAVYESRLSLPLAIWANHLVFNVYGDPSLRFNSTAFGGVSGRVLDESGTPIAGAIISSQDGKKLACSASDGKYCVSGLGVSSLNLTVSARGCYSQSYYDLAVAPGVALSLDFHLQRASLGGLTGFVRDEAGRPIAGALLALDASDRSVSSAGDGSFAFVDLEPGVYSVTVSKSPYAQQQVPGCLVNEGQASTVDITLRVRRGNVLTNGDFEGGFLQRLAYGWQGYSIPSGYGGFIAGYDQSHHGAYSQRLSLPSPPVADSRVGIMQVADCLPGQTYALTAWERDYISTKETDPSENIICRLGVDARGGIDAAAPGVVWTQFDPSHSVWNILSVSATPVSGPITVFFEATRRLQSGGNICYAWVDEVTLTGPIAAPSVPRVSVREPFIRPWQPIEASWTQSASSDAITYEYAVASSPDVGSIIRGGEWTNAGAGKSASISGLILGNGSVIYVLVRAIDSETGVVSEIGSSEPIRVVDAPEGIPEAKCLQDGTWVRIENVRVSRVGDLGWCFVQSSDGAAGIAVEGPAWSVPVVAPGTVASVVGRLDTRNDMRVIADAEVMPSIVAASPRPLGIANACVGGASYNYKPGPPAAGQKGSNWGRGLNNVGLLVSVWGRVRSCGPGYFIIDDGTLRGGLMVSCCAAARPPQRNPYVRVTGIAGPRGVIVCSQKDISELQ